MCQLDSLAGTALELCDAKVSNADYGVSLAASGIASFVCRREHGLPSRA
jgi:hypothetical protein